MKIEKYRLIFYFLFLDFYFKIMPSKTNYLSTIVPTWCPGCGNFGILTALNEALCSLKLRREKIVIVTDVGCAGNSADFFATYVFHALHGRALPPAVGIKLANHDLTVIVITGDGGLFGEGTTHFMNLCRGNHDLTVLFHDNMRYSLTTGQYAPTTPKGTKTPSTPEGVIEEAISPIELALACRPTFVARGYSFDHKQLIELIGKGIQHNGFSFIDILQPCVTFNKEQTIAWYQKMVKPFNGPLEFEDAFRLARTKDSLPTGLYYVDNKRLPYHLEVSTLKTKTLINQPITDISISSLLEEYQ